MEPNGQLAPVKGLVVVDAGGSVPSALTHSLGIGNVTDGSAGYRARTASAANLALEYSTDIALTRSLTTQVVRTDEASDFTGGGTVSGLQPDTQYFYSLLVNGVRTHVQPFPTFRTFPVAGVDAPLLTVAFGSCQQTPVGSVFAAMAADSPNLFLHLGDFGYPNSTDPAVLRASYRAQYDPAGDFARQIVAHMARAHVWDDHDYGGNNVNGDLVGKENSLAVFKEYIPTYPLANPVNGIWQSFRLANAEFFLLDTRYQRESSRPRFPDIAGGMMTAASGSGGDTFVIDVPAGLPARRDLFSPRPFDNWYRSYYCDVGGQVRRVIGYTGETRVLTLNRPIEGLAPGATGWMRQASMLDMDMIENGQLEWLIDGILSSQAKWKFLCSSVAWNPTFIGGGSSDVWGGWQAEQMENRYLIQRLAGVTNLIVLSGDRHRAGIDDGSSSVWPECSASPFENTNTTLGGNWSHGTYGRGPNFGLVEIRPTSVTLRVKNAIGADAPGITPLVVEAV